MMNAPSSITARSLSHRMMAVNEHGSGRDGGIVADEAAGANSNDFNKRDTLETEGNNAAGINLAALSQQLPEAQKGRAEAAVDPVCDDGVGMAMRAEQALARLQQATAGLEHELQATTPRTAAVESLARLQQAEAARLLEAEALARLQEVEAARLREVEVARLQEAEAREAVEEVREAVEEVTVLQPARRQLPKPKPNTKPGPRPQLNAAIAEKTRRAAAAEVKVKHDEQEARWGMEDREAERAEQAELRALQQQMQQMRQAHAAEAREREEEEQHGHSSPVAAAHYSESPAALPAVPPWAPGGSAPRRAIGAWMPTGSCGCALVLVPARSRQACLRLSFVPAGGGGVRAGGD